MSTKEKKNPIAIAIIVAIFIGVVCFAIYRVKYYQPELEMPPRMIVKDDRGELCELVLTSYDWTYKGERKTYDMKLSGKDISKYDYDAKNILLTDMFDYMKYHTVITTDPVYKNNGFIIISYEDMSHAGDMYEDGLRTDVEKHEPAEEFWFGSFSSSTAYHEITLNSEKQGTATYIFKNMDASNYALDRLKTTKLTNADDVKTFFSTENGGRFLQNVRIEQDKVILDYQYGMQENVTSAYACEIFALMDSINSVEFNFTHDKFVQTNYDRDNEEAPQTLEFDKAKPVVYEREGFKTYDQTSVIELKRIIEK